MQEFTKTPTACVKCGGTLIDRHWNKYNYGIKREYLLCYCNGCGYEWEQETKDAHETNKST